jgi:outer membrane protein TolC
MSSRRTSTVVTFGLVVAVAAGSLAAQEPAAAPQADPREALPAVTLDQAIEMALTVNPNVVRAQGDMNVASAERRQAYGSWLPTLSTNGSSNTNYSSVTRVDQSTGLPVESGTTSTTYSAGFNSTLEIFSGFRRTAELRSTRAGIASADATLVSREFQVVLETKQAYFNALAADELVRVSDRRIERALESLKISRDKLAAGSAIRSDTLRAVVELGNAELQRLNAVTARATAEASLARLVGLVGSVRPVRDSSLFAPVATDTVQLRIEALESAPTILAADATADVAAANVGVARAQYFPSLTASGSLSWNNTSVAATDTRDWNSSWNIRLGVSWPLFNGFVRETNVARQAANRDAARATAEDSRRQVNALLTQYLASLVAARQRYEIAVTSLTAATEDLRVQQQRYRLGASTFLEILASQVNLDQADIDRVQAALDYLVAKAQIEALIGREL